MAMMTLHPGHPLTARPVVARPRIRHRALDRLTLVLLAPTSAIAGALLSAGAVSLLVVAAGGSPALGLVVVRLWLPFLVVTVPVMGVWLVGALATSRAIRSVGGGISAADLAAFAVLERLLEGS